MFAQFNNAADMDIEAQEQIEQEHKGFLAFLYKTWKKATGLGEKTSPTTSSLKRNLQVAFPEDPKTQENGLEMDLNIPVEPTTTTQQVIEPPWKKHKKQQLFSKYQELQIQNNTNLQALAQCQTNLEKLKKQWLVVEKPKATHYKKTIIEKHDQIILLTTKVETLQKELHEKNKVEKAQKCNIKVLQDQNNDLLKQQDLAKQITTRFAKLSQCRKIEVELLKKLDQNRKEYKEICDWITEKTK
jgi:hypothetical protein